MLDTLLITNLPQTQDAHRPSILYLICKVWSGPHPKFLALKYIFWHTGSKFVTNVNYEPKEFVTFVLFIKDFHNLFISLKRENNKQPLRRGSTDVRRKSVSKVSLTIIIQLESIMSKPLLLVNRSRLLSF